MVGDRKGDASIPPGVTAPGRRPSWAHLTEAGEGPGGPEDPVPGGGLDALDDFAAAVRHTATPAPPPNPAPAPPTVTPSPVTPPSVASPPVTPPSVTPHPTPSPGTSEEPAPPPSGAEVGPAPGLPGPAGADPASPDLAAAVAATGTVVTDEDRNRFGMLLDRSLERGLLSPVEYDVRLGRLAEATTVEEMTDIVTDFPAFQAQAEALANLGKKGRRATGRVVVPAGALGTAGTDTPRRRLNSWILLTIVILVLAAATVILLITMRTVHNRPPTGAVTRTAPTLLVAPAAPPVS